MPKFNTRGFTSLLLSFTFLLVLATGLVLWLAHSPQTFGIEKGIWKHAHIFVSLLMAAAAILHFALNWPVYWSYLWKRAAGGLQQKRELALALGITLLVVGTSALHPSDDMMKRFAAMSLQEIGKMSDQPIDQFVSVLKKEGISVHDPADSLLEIAEHNKVSPQAVCDIVLRNMPEGAMRHGPR